MRRSREPVCGEWQEVVGAISKSTLQIHSGCGRSSWKRGIAPHSFPNLTSPRPTAILFLRAPDLLRTFSLPTITLSQVL